MIDVTKCFNHETAGSLIVPVLKSKHNVFVFYVFRESEFQIIRHQERGELLVIRNAFIEEALSVLCSTVCAIAFQYQYTGYKLCSDIRMYETAVSMNNVVRE